ncbi:MAG: putative porin [Saprospiraceae bacterium]|nr:putative porin [Saprospiraceae bacterium]
MFASAPERIHPDGDTLPDAAFRMYDPARQPIIDWGTLGNIGASARPLFFQTDLRRGVQTGYRVFDLYHLDTDDLPFYLGRRALTDLFVSRGRNQNDLMVRAKFSRTFARGTNFSLFHQNIVNIGQYQYQAARHMALTFGLWHPIGRRLESFLMAARNVSRQQENGGLANPSEITGGLFGGPITASIRLPDLQALTRHASTALTWLNHWTPVGDSAARKRTLRLTHRTEWSMARFKFSDPGSRPGLPLRNDTAFFGTFLVDRRGIRHYAELERLENSIELATFKRKEPQSPSDLLAVGVQHTFFRWRQEPFADTSLQNLFLTGRLLIAPSKRFALLATGSAGLLANFGEYQLHGQLRLSLGKAGELRAALISQRYPPALLAHRLGVSQRPFWQNAFEKPVENMLAATYALPAAGLSVTAQTHQVNNYLYFDQRGLPAQTSAPLQVAQLLVRENLRWKRLRLDLTLASQRFNRTDVVRLPEWFVKGALYHSGYLFQKRLLLEAGADFRWNSAFRADAYQPLTAQFHLQDTFIAQPYLWIDVFAAFKVQAFRFFFRYENLTTLWADNRLFFQTAYYAQPFGAIRLGVAWRFLDSERTDPPAASTPPGRAPR